MTNAAVPECLRCGACCFGDGARYARVSGDDHQRLGADADRLTQFIDNRCYMRMVAQHCAALVRGADGSFVCGVYDRRPSVCRELARGSRECAAELMRKGERSQRALLPLLRTVA